ncbi:hypothetical protein CONLIGDRAFT_581876 [Coniochaeta ligniaria NRRL 30616]|uniref:Rhodopsin domain-containing protein n=1 Tax=Coniochaeta ligniaria NRRL 30616 TaxID=1408157 RepID=A0A1J7ICX7_9PEZI|nr:hypothetical protein CONLIGDRAFT_581876 [Coniochaeta ligniaria NRRL 30616]
METTEDLGPQLNAVVWVLLGFSGLFLALRLYCKFLKKRGLWWDDHVLVASWLAFLVDVICVSVSISLGFGKHVFAIDTRHLPPIQILGNVSASASILAAVWSKTSFGITLLRIAEGKMKPAIWFIIMSMNLLMGVSALMPWIQCDPVSKTWNRDEPGSCWDPRVNIVYGVVAGSYSGVMDIVLALLPWSVVWNLQMKKKEKVGVAVAMSMGVFAGCTAFVKSAKIPLLTNGDFTFQGYNLAAWGAAEVATTVMASSIPVLRVLIREVKATTRRLYGSSSDDTYQKKSYGAGPLARSNTVVVAASQKRGALEIGIARLKSVRKAGSDDWSDTSVLVHEPGKGEILQTQEINIQYHVRDPRFEMDDMGDDRV